MLVGFRVFFRRLCFTTLFAGTDGAGLAVDRRRCHGHRAGIRIAFDAASDRRELEDAGIRGTCHRGKVLLDPHGDLGANDRRAIDDLGREAEAAVGHGPEGLTVAVASAVARLRGFPSPVRTATNTRDIDGTTVVTVLLELPGGEKAAGAAIVTGGLPFTVGRAVDSALTAL